jgi:hypothetical protein
MAHTVINLLLAIVEGASIDMLIDLVQSSSARVLAAIIAVGYLASAGYKMVIVDPVRRWFTGTRSVLSRAWRQKKLELEYRFRRWAEEKLQK